MAFAEWFKMLIVFPDKADNSDNLTIPIASSVSLEKNVDENIKRNDDENKLLILSSVLVV